jgi:hypothetical protein
MCADPRDPVDCAATLVRTLPTAPDPSCSPASRIASAARILTRKHDLARAQNVTDHHQTFKASSRIYEYRGSDHRSAKVALPEKRPGVGVRAALVDRQPDLAVGERLLGPGELRSKTTCGSIRPGES